MKLLMGGSPCFGAGTLVLTSEGYKKIENVSVGDNVLTHRNRFMPVTSIGGKLSEAFILSAQGILPTVVTGNHRYYVRNQNPDERTKGRRQPKSLGTVDWVQAKDLKKNESHIAINQLQTAIDIPELSDQDLWLLGRYVADGHNRITKRKDRKNSYQYQLVLSIGSHKLDEFKEKITERHFSCYPHTKSVHRCVFCSEYLCKTVEKMGFGNGAINKNIPIEIMNLPKDRLNVFLDGYFSGDGCFLKTGISCCTISEMLCVSLCMAILKVYGVSAKVCKPKLRETSYIEGRTVNCHQQYVVSFRFEKSFATNGRLIDNQMWTSFKSLEPTRAQIVYNLSVLEDESYTANNAIVHNCTYWSVAQSPDKRETTAEGLGWELFKNFLIARDKFQPDYFLYENNKSMSKEIKAQITAEFGFEPVLINSALVSAQNRQRLYWLGKREEDGSYSKVDVEQPEDRGLAIKDILTVPIFDRKQMPMPNARETRNYIQFDVNGKGQNSQQDRAYFTDGKFSCLPSARANTKVKITCSGLDFCVDLTLDEVKALQTVPIWYEMPMYNGKPNISMIQLGNGWTVEVIRHLLRACDGLYTEPVDVLSMYDGMACGHISLNEEGIEISRYRATEIDKYAIQTACHNFPDIEQIGDAFQVREDGWE